LLLKSRRERGKQEEEIVGYTKLRGVLGAHVAPSCKESQDLLNTVLKGSVWWPNNPTRVATTGAFNSLVSEMHASICFFNNI